jgi:hypothetical protein
MAARGHSWTPVQGIATQPSPQEIAEALRARICPPEQAFDALLPSPLRALSRTYWTPLPAIVRAAEWFEEFGVRSVVDIGSGAGKFCVAAALASDCRYTGLEQRPGLLAAARELARLFGIEDRVDFVEGVFGRQPPPPADAYYLYNPFGESLITPEKRIPEPVQLGDARYLGEVAAMEDFLEAAPPGTYLLTYNGFGGHPPAGYRQLHSDRELPNPLRLWRKEVEPPQRRRPRSNPSAPRKAA